MTIVLDQNDGVCVSITSYTIKKRAFMKKVRELMKDEEGFNVDERFYHNRKYFMYPRFALELDSFKGTGMLSEEVPIK